MASGSEQNLARAGELSKLAEDLRRMVAQFKVRASDDEIPEPTVSPTRASLSSARGRAAGWPAGRPGSVTTKSRTNEVEELADVNA